MKDFIVGGAVRDQLLGLPMIDRDWVVVGSDIAHMLSLNFEPVGRDFPVFLHPETKEQYALARTERKTAPGYRGFFIHADPSVTLEEDLLRRDLTINAMAMDRDGHIIDPYHGQEDLKNKILRHVSPAFIEDPVRVLRLARFYARFHEFSVAPETANLVHDMVHSGELDSLVPERIWQEIANGLLVKYPVRMFDLLSTLGVLEKIAPVIAKYWLLPHSDFPDMCSTRAAVLSIRDNMPLSVRVAALLSECDSVTLDHMIKLWSIPYKYSALVRKTLYFVQHNQPRWSAPLLIKLLQNWGIYHSLDMYKEGLQYLSVKSQPTYFHKLLRLLAEVCESLCAIDTQKIIQQQSKKEYIAEAIHSARHQAVQKILQQQNWS